VIRSFGESERKPTIRQFPFGHILKKLTLPIGVRARLSSGSVVCLEPACAS
jgi:muramoyltetrapeptide carboxypeptidase LdcA involved in peptidoglycan recycling